MENAAFSQDVLQALRGHGVNITLDDFGTGYPSLVYLTRVPVGNIKVDRCFVSGLLDGRSRHGQQPRHARHRRRRGVD